LALGDRDARGRASGKVAGILQHSVATRGVGGRCDGLTRDFREYFADPEFEVGTFVAAGARYFFQALPLARIERREIAAQSVETREHVSGAWSNDAAPNEQTAYEAAGYAFSAFVFLELLGGDVRAGEAGQG
jgi:hypothetical protein